MIGGMYLLQQAKDTAEWRKTYDRMLLEMDIMLAVLNALITLYSFVTGLVYYGQGRVGFVVFNGVVACVSVVNLICTIHRMIRRRKSAKLSQEYWEAEIEILEELLNEDDESEVDIR